MRIVSDLRPICIKSDTQYNLDQIYRDVLNLVGQMTEAVLADDFSGLHEARKNQVIGPKMTVLEALALLHTIACKRSEIKFKYQRSETSKPVTKTITKNDLEIIKEYLQRAPQSEAAEDDGRA